MTPITMGKEMLIQCMYTAQHVTNTQYHSHDITSPSPIDPVLHYQTPLIKPLGHNDQKGKIHPTNGGFTQFFKSLAFKILAFNNRSYSTQYQPMYFIDQCALGLAADIRKSSNFSFS